MKALDDRPPTDATATGPPVEVLFPGAKRRQRRRRLGWLGAIVVIVGASAGIYEVVGTGRPSTGTGRGHLATRAQLRSFIGRAERGTTGAFVASYQVTAWADNANGRLVSTRITAAQLETGVFSYQETPQLSWPAVRGGRTETFWAWVGAGKHTLANAGPGIYVCSRGSKRGSWSCANDSGDLMGGQSTILDNYPPYGFELNLQNAIYNYTSEPRLDPNFPQERAHLTTISWRGQTLTCFEFGSVTRPVAYACLDSHNVVARYSLPRAAGVGDLRYDSATLISYSRSVPRGLLMLPATPTRGT